MTTSATSTTSTTPSSAATSSPLAPTADRQRRPLLLAGSAIAFFGWLGYLAFLALTAGKPAPLSRPQLFAADLVVVADVEALDRPVAVAEVIHAAGRTADTGESIAVQRWEDVRVGWEGPGRYVLALTAVAGETGYRVTPIPRSPGYAGGSPRIYRATPQTVAQVRALW